MNREYRCPLSRAPVTRLESATDGQLPSAAPTLVLEDLMWMWLHDDRLRTRHTHAVAMRTAAGYGRISTAVRIGCCLIVIGAGLAAAGPSSGAWWLALVLLPLIGTVLAIVHSREE